jgi:hypothetical protein
MYVSTRTQEAPFAQGLDEHTSDGSEQVGPVKLVVHLQTKPLLESMQVPPFSHGDDLHSLMLVSQRVPV